MRDISEIEDERILRDLLKAEPNSLVEYNQRLGVSIEYRRHGVGNFGTVVCFEESARTWKVLFESNCAFSFNEDDIVEALEIYKKEKSKDTGKSALV